MKILLVEDSPINSYVISNMLTILGYQADRVENGQQALDSLGQKKYDLILMDCDMPVLDGYATTQAIRHREQTQGQPAAFIIALTAHLTAEHCQKCQVAGMNDCLAKPIHLQTLRTLLEHRQSTALPAQTPPSEAVTSTSVIDTQVLKQLEELMEADQVRQLIQHFLDYAPQQLMTLQQLVADGEREALRRKAHQFKGESSQLGAMRVAENCKEIESLALTATPEVIQTYLTKLQIELDRVSETLTQVTQHDH